MVFLKGIEKEAATDKQTLPKSNRFLINIKIGSGQVPPSRPEADPELSGEYIYTHTHHTHTHTYIQGRWLKKRGRPNDLEKYMKNLTVCMGFSYVLSLEDRPNDLEKYLKNLTVCMAFYSSFMVELFCFELRGVNSFRLHLLILVLNPLSTVKG